MHEHDTDAAQVEQTHAKHASSASLIVAATPIGNAQDASPRLRRLLATTPVIVAEDTRRLKALLARLQITLSPTTRLVSYFEGNEHARTAGLVQLMSQGTSVVLVTDAGMPAVSDPGFRLVDAAVKQGLPVTVVPGPSAVLAALVVSGLAVDRFCFEGFLPRKTGQRAARLAQLADETRTMVFFEAPHRIAPTLQAMGEAWGPQRPAAVCRELTKTYEQVLRGSLEHLAQHAHQHQLRGEITVVVAGCDNQQGLTPVDAVQLAEQVKQWVQQGQSRQQAIATVAKRTGVSKRVIFDALVRAKASKEASH